MSIKLPYRISEVWAKISEVDGTSIYDVFTVGREVKANTPFKGKVVEYIDCQQLDYTKSADIYFTDKTKQSIEDIKQIYYVS